MGILALPALIILIIYYWKDAKFGTIANLIIFAISFVGLQSWRFENLYREDVREGFERNANRKEKILTEKDIEHLPLPV